ncbi:MAG: SAM-dependent methyltransferase [Phycisphaerae bacterium]|jgi:tRNA-Thr(GGU) m(6)t(6)A37 methyltransferase TsaA
METFTVKAIGRVSCARREAIDDDWDSVPSAITLDPAVCGVEALAGIEAFSHVEVIYLFDQVGEDAVVTGARHPRGREDWPRVGIFAQRGKNRPNRLGATICRIVGVEGRVLRVSGLDAIDGTPVIDIKPVMSGFLPRGEVREPGWALEIMKDYW